MADLITVEQFGLGRFIRGSARTGRHRRRPPGACARAGDLRRPAATRLVILDEANVAAACGLFPPVDLLDLISARPEGVEVVLTGRNAAA
ncbi:MAG: cob(I)yrinic acid a,c-diamide adenosyltransferase [Desulfobacterales bacterium]|nr:cob(I)yrinic acid a,c-diamide adenosyltransferase [Desulfobacterales bacterium]